MGAQAVIADTLSACPDTLSALPPRATLEVARRGGRTLSLYMVVRCPPPPAGAEALAKLAELGVTA